MSRAWRTVAIVLGVFLGPGATGIQEQPDAVDHHADAKLSLIVSREQIVLRGDVSSVAHESILRQRVRTLFPDKAHTFELRERPALPAGWALLSELTLRAIAATYSSETDITPGRIHIRGTTNNPGALREGLARIERNLLPGMQLDHGVHEIPVTGSLDRQCTSLFRTAISGRKIEFPRAKATLTTRWSPLLDELIQIAADCPEKKIEITGHTDNTGVETGNIALSEARARAIADYMIGRGFPAERIVAIGAGSSRPLVDADTPQAHQLNRRIDIELKNR